MGDNPMSVSGLRSIFGVYLIFLWDLFVILSRKKTRVWGFTLEICHSSSTMPLRFPL